MAAYIQTLVSLLLADFKSKTPPLRTQLTAIYEEASRLDPRDFAPSARATFVRSRAELASLAASPDRLQWSAFLERVLTELSKVLDDYGGPGRFAHKRKFEWLSSTDLQGIVERDYAELQQVLLPDGAWKSTVVMSGSLLEAILYDLLAKEAGRLALAMAAKRAPKASARDGGGVLPVEKWKLDGMIKVAEDIGLLPKERAETFDQILRDYRNFVHPTKELRAEHPCGEGEALMAKGAIDAVCDHFDRLRDAGTI